MTASPNPQDGDNRRQPDAIAASAPPIARSGLPHVHQMPSVAGDARSALPTDNDPHRPRRRIGLHHIAFLRGYFEGLDPATLAEQYLDFGRDRKRAQVARRWIVDELVAAARKKGDSAGARLLKLPAGALPSAVRAPDEKRALSLDAFRDQVDPDGAFSEAELLELFGEAQQDAAEGADAASSTVDRRAARNARLRQRQRLLLDSLEASLAEPPKRVHPIAHWLDPALAARLASAGLLSVDDLFTFVNRYGYRWYRRVHRVGEQSARRVLQWFDRNAQDLGCHLSPHARLPRSLWPASYHGDRRREPASDAIAPIEFFAPSQPEMKRDRDALLACLERYRAVPTTFRAYRTQAERLLLWSNRVARKPLTALTAADANVYLSFMTNPMPRDTWCGKKTDRGTAAWRPFEAPASASTVAIAQRILRTLFDQLLSTGYDEDGRRRNAAVDPASPCISNPFRINIKRRLPTAGPRPSLGASDAATVPRQVVFESNRTGNDMSCRSTKAAELRHARMRMVLSLIRDTAAPLTALVDWRVGMAAEEGEKQDKLCTSPPLAHRGDAAVTVASGTLRGRLSASTRSAVDTYLGIRRALLSEPFDEAAFLVGRHQSSPSMTGSPRALTANVLGRAIAHYLKQADKETGGVQMAPRSAIAAVEGAALCGATLPGQPPSPVAETPPQAVTWPRNLRQWRRSFRPAGAVG